jgi:hypothetical protein
MKTMLFKFNKKKIVIDAFTSSHLAFESCKITRSAALIPDWFKRLKKPSMIELARDPDCVQTMKMCPGFSGLYSKGFIIPLWTDVFVCMSAYDGNPENSQVSLRFSDGVGRADFHLPAQFEGFLTPYGQQQVKIKPPWLLKTTSKVKFIMTGCPWNYPKGVPFTVLPGELEFRLNRSCHVNAYLSYKDTDQEIMLDFGSPLAQVIPLSERDIEIRSHLISDAEFNQIYNVNASACSFSQGYRKTLKRIDR